MSFRHIKVRPIAGALGAEVSGIDLRTAGEAAFDEFRQALRDNLVVFVRDQPLSPDEQMSLTQRFGPFCEVPHASRRLEGYPDILEVVDKAISGNPRNVGGNWHTDMPFLERPPAQCILYGKTVPDWGGDTQWTNLCAAYEALSDGIRATLQTLTAVHSATRIAGSRFVGENRREVQPPVEEMDREITHPLVRTHVETGRKCLFVNRATFLRFTGWTEAESVGLHEYLCGHATRSEFTCRFRWSPDTVTIWDNRCTQHYAIDHYAGTTRVMYRTSVQGERPV